MNQIRQVMRAEIYEHVGLRSGRVVTMPVHVYGLADAAASNNNTPAGPATLEHILVAGFRSDAR
jgi:hypothetical protein